MRRHLPRVLTVAGAVLAAGVVTTPAAHAAASSCSHDWSGPQVCISTDGENGSGNPGTVTAAWTNPPKDRKAATVYISEPDGFKYAIKGHRSGGQIIASTVPNRTLDGKLCARFKGMEDTACVTMIQRL